MGEQTSTALRPDELTPHTLNQVYRQIVATAQGSVNVGRPLVAVRGQLGLLHEKGPSTKYFYEVPLSDDEGMVYLDVPKELVWRADIREGDYVKAVGVITTKFDRFTNYQLLFKVDVSHIVLIDAPTDLARHRDDQDKLALLKGKTGRTPFPQKPRLSLSVIHSTSGQVSGDFQHEIVKVADIIDVAYLPVNMTNAGAIAEAIEAAEGDILAIIRGGGPVEQFSVFEDPRVLNALACKHDVYRVLGLGHTNTMTFLDVVSGLCREDPVAGGKPYPRANRMAYLSVAASAERAGAQQRPTGTDHSAGNCTHSGCGRAPAVEDDIFGLPCGRRGAGAHLWHVGGPVALRP